MLDQVLFELICHFHNGLAVTFGRNAVIVAF